MNWMSSGSGTMKEQVGRSTYMPACLGIATASNQIYENTFRLHFGKYASDDAVVFWLRSDTELSGFINAVMWTNLCWKLKHQLRVLAVKRMVSEQFS